MSLTPHIVALLLALAGGAPACADPVYPPQVLPADSTPPAIVDVRRDVVAEVPEPASGLMLLAGLPLILLRRRASARRAVARH